MILNVVADGQSFPVEVPDSMLAEGQDMFNKMDADMDLVDTDGLSHIVNILFYHPVFSLPRTSICYDRK